MHYKCGMALMRVERERSKSVLFFLIHDHIHSHLPWLLMQHEHSPFGLS